MKYVIIIPDGAADMPLDELDGKTPFQVAHKPHTDRLSIDGRQGTVATTPPGMPCGSDVCSMSLLGYDPRKYHTGRAPLEAAARGIGLSDTDWVFRVNCVTVIDENMADHSAGHIRDQEARTLLDDFQSRVDMPGMTLYPGVGYRHLMVDRQPGRDWSELATTAPHDIPNQPIRKHLPVGGEYAGLLQQFIAESQTIFGDHEINLTRREMGELPATHLWPWGQGRRPKLDTFASRFGLKGAMITAVDLLAGLASFIGWDRLDVPGQTSYHDNDYAAAGQHAIRALEQYDIICVHLEAPDEAGHAADADTKVTALEAIDTHVVGPLHDALQQQGDHRLLYLPDHYTRVDTRKHDPTPVPFAICGTQVRSVLNESFTEAHANASDLHIAHGHELMEYFLHAGLK